MIHAEEVRASFERIGSGAEFSPCLRYRYALSRRWSDGPAVLFVGLNPSTADALKDDPTIRRCVGFAKAWDYGALYMANLFAFRSTDPGTMMIAGDPVGPDNDAWLRALSAMAHMTVAAWGVHGSYRAPFSPGPRDLEVGPLLPEVRCLGKNRDGSPRHPLYLPAATIPELYVCRR